MDLLILFVIVVIVIFVLFMVMSKNEVQANKLRSASKKVADFTYGTVEKFAHLPVGLPAYPGETYLQPIYSGVDPETGFYINSDEIYAYWGDFDSSTSSISLYGGETEHLLGEVSNAVIRGKICVIVSANQSLITPFKNKLKTVLDLRNFAFKIIPVVEADIPYPLHILINIRGSEPTPPFKTVKSTMANSYFSPFETSTTLRTNPEIITRSQFQQMSTRILSEAKLIPIGQILVIASPFTGYYIAETSNLQNGEKIAIIALDHAAAQEGSLSELAFSSTSVFKTSTHEYGTPQAHFHLVLAPKNCTKIIERVYGSTLQTVPMLAYIVRETVN
jgi:hypothetical protein